MTKESETGKRPEGVETGGAPEATPEAPPSPSAAQSPQGAESPPVVPSPSAESVARETSSAPEPAGSPPKPEPASPSRAGLWVGTLALIVALGGYGYAQYAATRVARQEQALRAESLAHLSALSDKVQAQQALLITLQQQVAGLTGVDAQVAALKEALREVTESLAQTRERLAKDEADLDRLQTIAKSAAEMTEALAKLGDRRWIVEAGEALAFAQRQLAWDGNLNAAQGALATLAARLKEADRPLLRPLRQAVEADLLAIEAAPRVDLDGILAKLASLDQLLTEAPYRFTAEVDRAHTVATATGDDSPWYLRAWAAVVAFGHAVGQEWAHWLRLERIDAQAPELLSPQQSATLQLNISTWIAAARVAASRGDEIAYRTALEKLEATLARYFDPAAPQTRAAQAALSELKAQKVRVERPTLERSLKALSEIEARVATVTALPAPKE